MTLRLQRLLPLCVALGGCALEPDDPVYLSGTALEADGTPWRGGPLTLMRPRKVDLRIDPDQGEVFGTRYVPWGEVTPGDDGLFLHALEARDVGADDLKRPHPWTDLTAFQLHLPRADGGRDFLWFQFDQAADLPPLRAWDSQVRTVDEAGGVRLSWKPFIPSADMPEPHYFVRLQGEDGMAWQVRADSDEPWLRPEWVEDFTDQAHVQAVSKGDRARFKSTLNYNAVSDSPPVTLPFPVQVPASRGAGCALRSIRFEPCPLTDGRLALARVSSPQEALPEELFILLEEPVRPRRVILRGLDGFGDVLHVEGSVDGTSWLPLGDSARFADVQTSSPYDEDPARQYDPEQFLDVTLAAEAPAVSRIRLRMTSRFSNGETGDGQFRSLREVSVFGAPTID